MKNAEAAESTKNLEIQRIQGELALLNPELEAAKALLANSEKLLDEANKAAAAEQKAQQDYDLAFDQNDAAFKAMKAAEAECTKFEKQEDDYLDSIGDLEKEQTRIDEEEVAPKQTAYNEVINRLDPTVYDADRIAAINDAEAALSEARKTHSIANTRVIEATEQAKLAEDVKTAAE